jgi:membrane protein DedA with SNARE-associated domain
MALMAMESSILPVPSECVIPPAVFLEYRIHHSMPLAVLLVAATSTLGSLLGSLAMYGAARAFGRPLILTYGKYIGLSREKLLRVERLVAQYGAGGIVLSRLLPVARHLIGIPAGMMGMRLRTYLLATFAGSALWCTVLAIFGMLMAHDIAQVLQHGNNLASVAYQQAFRHLSQVTGGIISLVVVLYGIFFWCSRRKRVMDDTHEAARKR